MLTKVMGLELGPHNVSFGFKNLALSRFKLISSCHHASSQKNTYQS